VLCRAAVEAVSFHALSLETPLLDLDLDLTYFAAGEASAMSLYRIGSLWQLLLSNEPHDDRNPKGSESPLNAG